MNIRDMIAAEAIRQGVDPELATKVGRQESRFRADAVSPAGARGPMQLMPGTARDLGVNIDDPADNIRGGVTYLKQQLDAFGSPRLALAAYNAGPGRVRRSGGVPNIPETQNYVRTIIGDGPRSGADIFGMDAPAPKTAPTAQAGGSGADIFADAPDATPAATSAPVAAPAGPKPVSEGLGFLKGMLPAAAKLAPYSPANLIPGFRDANAAVLARLPGRIAQREQTETPGKLGEFVGNIGSVGWVPGGPAVSGAGQGYLLSQKPDLAGKLGDAAFGAIGGKLGTGLVAGAGGLVRGLTGDALKLAQKGVPLTIGQMLGGPAKSIEDKATSIPFLGDVIKNAQRRGIEGANRAAFNDTLSHVGETLPDHVDIGHDAYAYTKQRLSDLYDDVLAPLTVTRDQAWSQALTTAKAKIAKIGDKGVKADALNIIKAEINARFDKAGQMAGDALKDAQSDLGSHANALLTDASPKRAWNRKAGEAIGDLKTALEGLVARTDPAAGEQLAKINTAYAHLKPLETATQKAGVKTAGVWNINQLAQGVTKGKSASTVASGNAPHQDLASAAARVLPSSVPDSGTAGRLMGPAALGMLFGGHLPVVGPAAIPAAGLIGGMASLYSRGGQKALTLMMKSRDPTVRALGEKMRLLAAPAGLAGAVTVSGARQ